MATVSAQLADFRNDNATNQQQLTDANGLRWYNDGRDLLIDRIIKEKEDFFYNENTFSIVNGQREYSLPKRGSLATDGVTVLDGVAKIKGVSIKFKDTDTSYTKLAPKTLNLLDADLKAYENWTDAFYIVSDQSIFIYPNPTEDIANWGIIYVINYPKKLALSDSETLSDNYSKAIMYYVAARFFQSQRQLTESQLFDAKFEAEMNRVAVGLSGRIQEPTTITTPSLRFYS